MHYPHISLPNAKPKAMTVGIPKALLYFKYAAFARTFFEALGARVVVSPDTNRQILDAGVLCCADEACLPVKVFHGHVSWLASRCDCLLIPRFMRMEKGKSICPMFCGLPDMVRNAVPNLPPLIDAPVWSLKKLDKWAMEAGREIADTRMIRASLYTAQHEQQAQRREQESGQSRYRVALIGHAYNLCDRFVNMDLLRKLERLNISTAFEEDVAEADIARAAERLFKAPFWYYAKRYYGAAAHLCASGAVDGVLYVSAFSCGVDSVVTELIAHAAGDVPLMVLKLDEHTGEAALMTRLEAFADMLERRSHGHHVPADGQYLAGCQGVL
jgi:predicted nucleotide-binding protein (sugar kinase/HSP70/actin superfamily)